MLHCFPFLWARVGNTEAKPDFRVWQKHQVMTTLITRVIMEGKAEGAWAEIITRFFPKDPTGGLVFP